MQRGRAELLEKIRSGEVAGLMRRLADAAAALAAAPAQAAPPPAPVNR